MQRGHVVADRGLAESELISKAADERAAILGIADQLDDAGAGGIGERRQRGGLDYRIHRRQSIWRVLPVRGDATGPTRGGP